MTTDPERPLDYQTPSRKGPAGGVPPIAQIAIGSGSAMAVLVIAGYATLTAYNSASGAVLLYPLLAVMAFISLLLIAASIVAYKRWRWTAAPIGVAIGIVFVIGLPLLAIGLCFAAFAGLR